MQSMFSDALSRVISKHMALSVSRRETLSWLVLLVMQRGSVCLWRLAAHVAGGAQTASVQRRFYRFFQFVRLDGAMSARIIVDLLGLRGTPWVLAIDRTNWEFGKTSINFLMISLEWQGTGIPLIWSLLPSAGNSGTTERAALLDRLHGTFPDLEIAMLTGDREFIGDAWMAHLERRKIPFVLRLRENQHVRREGHETWTIAAIARRLAPGGRIILKGLCQLGRDGCGSEAPAVRLAILRLASGELLALACSSAPRHAFARYRARWRIETMFGNLKTKGFNIEDTHLRDPAKLAALMAIVAIALALSVKTGAAAARLAPIPLKKHGRKAVSIFAKGLNALRKILAGDDRSQVSGFLETLFSPKSPLKSLKHITI
jgi:transposase